MSTEAFEELVEDFDFLDDWEDRYRAVIDEGKAMPVMDSSLQVEANKVHGCASQVWMFPRVEDGKFHFDGESDALIVKGLIAILQKLYNGTHIEQARSIDAFQEMGRLGLNDHLSAQRSNGLRSMIEKINIYLSENQ